MLDDLLELALEAVGQKALPKSKRAEGCARVLFGLMLIGLSLAGAWYTVGYDASLPFRFAGIALFLALAAFGLFNVVLLRRWRWPGCAFVLALVGLFLVALLFEG